VHINSLIKISQQFKLRNHRLKQDSGYNNKLKIRKVKLANNYGSEGL